MEADQARLLGGDVDLLARHRRVGDGFVRSSYLKFDMEKASHGEVYKLLIGLIAPRPIALITSMDEHGGLNAAPFSAFNYFCTDPPIVGIGVTNRTDRAFVPKDTARNIRRTGEFVVNVVSASIAAQANVTAAEVGPEVDEFVLAGLTPLASEAVRPARVAEAPAQMECKLLQVIYTNHAPGGGVIVLGEVLRFHVRQDLIEDFRVDPAGLDAVGRMAGNTWVHTRDRMELTRPK